MSTKTCLFEWQGSVEHGHVRATYFVDTVNEVKICLPSFDQAYALANCIEAQARVARYDTRYELLQEIGRIEP